MQPQPYYQFGYKSLLFPGALTEEVSLGPTGKAALQSKCKESRGGRGMETQGYVPTFKRTLKMKTSRIATFNRAWESWTLFKNL